MGSAHRAGWFRGSVLCCLSAAVPLWWLAPPPFSTGKRLTRFSGRCRSPTNYVRLPPRFAGGTMGAGQWHQGEFMAAAKRKPYNLAALVEMHPYSRFAGLPPEGEVLATLMFEMLMSLEAQRRANLPLRGRCRRQKGCISNGPKARLYGFRCRQRRHIYCGEAATFPLSEANTTLLHNPPPSGGPNLRRQARPLF